MMDDDIDTGGLLRGRWMWGKSGTVFSTVAGAISWCNRNDALSYYLMVNPWYNPGNPDPPPLIIE